MPLLGLTLLEWTELFDLHLETGKLSSLADARNEKSVCLPALHHPYCCQEVHASLVGLYVNL